MELFTLLKGLNHTSTYEDRVEPLFDGTLVFK